MNWYNLFEHLSLNKSLVIVGEDGNVYSTNVPNDHNIPDLGFVSVIAGGSQPLGMRTAAPSLGRRQLHIELATPDPYYSRFPCKALE
jgi:hypothetical protein